MDLYTAASIGYNGSMNADRSSTGQSRLAWDWAGAWTGVFVANLAVPVLFGFNVVGKEGVYGLIGALAVLFWIGFAICLFRFRIGRSLVLGGVAIAIFQVFPILQIICGALGLTVWDQIGGHGFFSSDGVDDARRGWQHDPNIASFVVVLVAAHPLMVLAVMFGAYARWHYGDRPIWFTHRTDPDTEPEPVAE